MCGWQLKYLFKMGVSSWANHSFVVLLVFLMQQVDMYGCSKRFPKLP